MKYSNNKNYIPKSLLKKIQESLLSDLRNSVAEYNNPFKPVSVDDWEVLK